MSLWDTHCATPGHKYGTAPNRFLTEHARLLAPGSQVRLPGDGEGRNCVWLATLDHRVHAVDASAVGLAKARALATERGVAMATTHADLARRKTA